MKDKMNLEIHYTDKDTALTEENSLYSLRKKDIKVFEEVIKYLYKHVGVIRPTVEKKNVLVTMIINSQTKTTLWISINNLNKEFEELLNYDLRKWSVEEANKHTAQELIIRAKEIYYLG